MPRSTNQNPSGPKSGTSRRPLLKSAATDIDNQSSKVMEFRARRPGPREPHRRLELCHG